MLRRLGSALVAVLMVGLAGPVLASISTVGARPVVAAPLASLSPQVIEICSGTCYRLTINLIGTGSGTYKSTNSLWVPNGHIDCSLVNGVKTQFSVCSYADNPLFGETAPIYGVLTPDAGSEGCFASCHTDALKFSASLTQDTSFTFTLTRLSYGVEVNFSGNGTVVSNPAGLSCNQNDTTCSHQFLYDTPVTLTATAASGWVFQGWDLDCVGTVNPCSFSVPARYFLAIAIFSAPTPPPTPSPTPTHAPTAPPTAAPTPTKTASPTKTPSPTTSVPTPTPTTPTVITPPPGATAQPTPLPPGVTPAPTATAGSTSSGAPGSSTFPSPSSIDQTSSPEPSLIAVVDPSGATSTPTVNVVRDVAPAADYTPIVLAVLSAGLLIALGIGAAGFALRGRRGPGPG
jgi:hypothetical protein